MCSVSVLSSLTELISNIAMETIKRDWMEQERRTVEEHQQHERMLMENIHDLRMENKVVEREKEEMRTLVEETVKENRRFRDRLDQVRLSEYRVK